MSYADDINEQAAAMAHNHAPRAAQQLPKDGPVRDALTRRENLIEHYNKGIVAYNNLATELNALSEAMALLEGPIEAARREVRDALEAHFGAEFSGCYTIDPVANEVVFMDHVDPPSGKQPDWAKQLAEDLGRAN